MLRRCGHRTGHRAFGRRRRTPNVLTHSFSTTPTQGRDGTTKNSNNPSGSHASTVSLWTANLDPWTRAFVMAASPEGATGKLVQSSSAMKSSNSTAPQQLSDSFCSSASDTISSPSPAPQIPQQTVTSATREESYGSAASGAVFGYAHPSHGGIATTSSPALPTVATTQPTERTEDNRFAIPPGGYPEGFDVIVIGGGHAGCEAAAAAAR